MSRSHGKSFGVGRDKIQKIHIDKEIDSIKKKIASPAPTNYNAAETFGKEGTMYSIRNRLFRYGMRYDGRDDYYFATQKKLPGPGFYNQPETVGHKLANSMHQTSRSNAFAKA